MFIIVAHLTSACQRRFGDVQHERISNPGAQILLIKLWISGIHTVECSLKHHIEDEQG
jgi:hypothetical protein